MQRRTYHFSGRVQGVGFRYSAHHLARGFASVRGYVRNLPDGRVEMVVEGDDKDMDGLLESLKRHMNDNIQRVDVSKSDATGEFASFTIRH